VKSREHKDLSTIDQAVSGDHAIAGISCCSIPKSRERLFDNLSTPEMSSRRIDPFARGHLPGSVLFLDPRSSTAGLGAGGRAES
jgi:hypothetical protein